MQHTAPDGSTKSCPKCGNTELVRLTTYNEKICTDCQIAIQWELEEGQEALHAPRKLNKRIIND